MFMLFIRRGNHGGPYVTKPKIVDITATEYRLRVTGHGRQLASGSLLILGFSDSFRYELTSENERGLRCVVSLDIVPLAE